MAGTIRIKDLPRVAAASPGDAVAIDGGGPAARSILYTDLVKLPAIRNAVVNPAVDVSQELGTTGAALTNNTAKYIADQWEGFYNHAAATAVVTSAQLPAASFGAALAGFQFGHQIKATTAITAPASGDFARHRQKIEGYRIAHWGWGAAGAASIVVAFRLYSTAAGTAFVKLSNSDQSRCYYHEIAVAAGWNFYAFTLAGDTAGTWQATTSAGLVFEVFVSGAEAAPAAVLDAWGATNKVQTTNSTNLLGTNNNLTVLTGVYIDVGTQLPAAADLPNLMRPFAYELNAPDLCKRYWEKSYEYGTALGTATFPGCEIVMTPSAGAATVGLKVRFAAPKRVAPSCVLYSENSGATGKIYDFQASADVTGNVDLISENGMRNYGVFAVVGGAMSAYWHWAVNARL